MKYLTVYTPRRSALFFVALVLAIALPLVIVAPQGHASVYQSQQPDTDWQQWKRVGEADLNVLFFDIYTSTLLSPDGTYQVSDDVTPHPMALNIRYERSISSKQLVDATVKQWLLQGVEPALANQWGQRMTALFPAVEEDDRLLYVTDGVFGELYFSRQSQPFTSLGKIDDEPLNDAFLGIWLSPNTEYPKHRLALIGKQ
jgi:hypothetical protein